MSIAVRSGYDLSLLKVLVVEDNKNMRKLLKTILNALGVTYICETTTGEEALKEMSRLEADLVICDWNMSPMDGLAFTRAVRSGPGSPNPYVPIIMLTGHTETERVIRARDAGINMFLAKPVSVKALSDRILALIENPRPFIRTESYFGPDRRRRDVGPPSGMAERRKTEPR